MPRKSHPALGRLSVAVERTDEGCFLARVTARQMAGGHCLSDSETRCILHTLEHGQHVQTPMAFLFVTVRNLACNMYRDQRAAATDPVGISTRSMS